MKHSWTKPRPMTAISQDLVENIVLSTPPTVTSLPIVPSTVVAAKRTTGQTCYILGPP